MSPLGTESDGLPQPPLPARLLVRGFVAAEVRDAVCRDLADRFAVMARENIVAARRWYWGQALRCLNPLHPPKIRTKTRLGFRAMRGSVIAGGLLDARHAARGLVKQPGFTATAVLTLGIGIGATTVIFSVVNGVLLRPLPYPEPDRLVNVWQVNTGWFDSPNLSLRSWADEFPASMPTFKDWEELNSSFSAVGAYNDHSATLFQGDRPERVYGTRVTSGVWRALGVAPLLGRTFLPEDDQPGAAPLVVLGHGIWQQRFGGDSTFVGTTIRLDQTSYTVSGVMPEGFYFPSAGHSLWTTFDEASKTDDRDSQYLYTLARLAPGVSLARALREMEALTERLVESREHNPEYGVRLVPRVRQVVGDVQLVLLLLLGAVGVVLLIACVNIANMLLVRATERRREFALRSALGAERGRLLRQLVTESLVLGVTGGIAGVGIAFASFKPLLAVLPSGLPRSGEVALDSHVLWFAVGISLLTGVLAGSLPAIRAARADLSETLQEGGRSLTSGRKRNLTQGVLVVSEIALAFVLLVGSGLLMSSFLRLVNVERGFTTEQILVFDLRVPEHEPRPSLAAAPRPSSSLSPEQESTIQYVNSLRERLEAVPGVRRVAIADNMPFMGGTSSGTVTIESPNGPEETNVEKSSVTPGYLEAMGVPVLRGRPFDAQDGTGAERVVVVSRGMAERYWPGSDPIGRRLKRGTADSDNAWMTVVGVAADVRHQGLHVEPRPKMYLPFSQAPRPYLDVVVKTNVPPDLAAAPLREAVAEFDPALPSPRIRELERVISSSVAAPRFRTGLVSLLAMVAALLAVIGVYGMLAYTIAQRRSEIGIRMALGATRSHVMTAVLGRGAALAGLGLLLGLAVSWVAVKVLNSFLYQTNVHDPAMFGAATALLAAAALAASYLPSRRATKVDPVDALRAE